MCNGCYFSVNHDQCVVRYLKSLNARTPKAKHLPTHTKQVWQVKKPTRKPTKKPRNRTEWRPTGRTFSLFATSPATRIVKHDDNLVEQNKTVSSSTNMSTTLNSLMVTLGDFLFLCLLTNWTQVGIQSQDLSVISCYR